MTYEELQANRSESEEDRLAQLREECRQRPSGHLWDMTDTNSPAPIKYCTHCYYTPIVDKAEPDGDTDDTKALAAKVFSGLASPRGRRWGHY
jgi:hypothetical protein